MSTLNFYDAIIIHSYAQVIKGKTLDGQMMFEEIERNNRKEEFQIYKDRIIAYFNNYYPNEIQQYSNIYNKPIWVTEWNFYIYQKLLEILCYNHYLLHNIF